MFSICTRKVGGEKPDKIKEHELRQQEMIRQRCHFNIVDGEDSSPEKPK